jgi:hypothetical protein
MRTADCRSAAAKVRPIRIRRRHGVPTLRRPLAGMTADAEYRLSWAYRDPPALTPSTEVDRDGHIAWFYRDRDADVTCGIDEERVQTFLRTSAFYAKRFA